MAPLRSRRPPGQPLPALRACLRGLGASFGQLPGRRLILGHPCLRFSMRGLEGKGDYAGLTPVGSEPIDQQNTGAEGGGIIQFRGSLASSRASRVSPAGAAVFVVVPIRTSRKLRGRRDRVHTVLDVFHLVCFPIVTSIADANLANTVRATCARLVRRKGGRQR